MIVDLSKIPSPCRWILWPADGYGYMCTIKEHIRGRTIEVTGKGETPQAAVDDGVAIFLGAKP
jgi:hypothetical protein